MLNPMLETNTKAGLNRLKFGLAKTRNQFMSQLSGLLRIGRKIDEDLMEEIEEILIQADVGVDTTLTLMDNVRERVKAEGFERFFGIGIGYKIGNSEFAWRGRAAAN